MNLSPLPIQKFFANSGRPLVGGLLFTYEAGTSIKVATYIDSSGVTPNANPVVLDYRGECRLWLDPQLSYKFILAPRGDTDPPTMPIWTVDNITVAPQSSDNAAVDTGSVNNISLSIPLISSPVAFTRVIFKAANSNTGATTLQINGGTAHAVTWQPDAALSGGEIIADGIYEVIFDGAQWQLQGPTLDPGDVRLYGATGDGVTDDRAAIQSAITAVAAAGGGDVSLPAGNFLIRRVASPDGLFNGLHIPFSNVFGYENHVTLRGAGRASVLLAGDNTMVLLRLSDSLSSLRDFVIDANGMSGVTGLGLLGSDVTAPALQEHIDWNVISRVDIRDCAEGVQLEPPSGGGCYYNRFEYCTLYSNTRHIRYRSNAVTGGANRNVWIGCSIIGGNTGLWIDGADTNGFIDCAFELIAVGSSPLATPTAIWINNVGTGVPLESAENNFISCFTEDCTRDLDCSNRHTSIIGGNIGAVGNVLLTATPDVWIGGDAQYRLRDVQMGGTADGIRLQPRAIAFLSNPQFATSSNQSGAYPFNGDGHVIVQGRQSNTHDVSVYTGSASTERVRVDGGGHINLLNADIGLNQSSAVVLTNGATITTALNIYVRVAPAGAVTGIIMEAGTQPGQLCIISNEGGGSVTFAAFGTSRVADGVATVIAVNKSVLLIWNSGTSAWYSNT